MGLSPAIEAALEFDHKLADLGVPIFRIPGDGVPGEFQWSEASGWQHTQPGAASHEAINAWRPGDALAAVMGHVFDGLDCDPRNGGGESLRRLKADGLMPQVWAVAATPSGGMHLYVKALGMPKCPLEGYPGIDYQAGTPDGAGRGILFLPPMERPSKVTGRLGRYSWCGSMQLPRIARSSVSAGWAADDSGAALRDYLRKHGKRGGSGTGNAPGRLEQAAAGGVPEGQRHTTLTSLAGSYRYVGHDAPSILARLRLDNADYCRPPLEDDELRSIAEGIGSRPAGDFTAAGTDAAALAELARRITADPAPESQASVFEELLASNDEYKRMALQIGFRRWFTRRLEDEDAAASAKAAGPSRAASGADFILAAPTQTPAIWGEGSRVLWAEGEGFMITAHQGLGKTTIGQQLLLHALGIGGPEFLELPVRQLAEGGRVLYLAMDRPAQAARSWRRMVTDADKDVLHERLVVWKGPLPVNVLASPDALADWAQEVCPGVSMLAVDSVKDLCPGLTKDEVGAGLNLAWQEVIARGVELLLLHHQRKAQGGATERLNTLDDVFGSTWLTSGLGSVVALEGQPGDPRVSMLHLKQPADALDPLMLEHNHETGRTRLLVAKQSVLEVLGTASGPMTAREIAASLYDTTEPDGAMLKRVRRDLEKYSDQEAVTEAAPGGSGVKGSGKPPARWVLAPGIAWINSRGSSV